MTGKEIKAVDRMMKKIVAFQKEVKVFASQLHNSGEVNEATVSLLKLAAQALDDGSESLGVDLMKIEDHRRQSEKRW